MVDMWSIERLRGCNVMPRLCAVALALSGSQLLGVARGDLHNFGPGLTADGVDDCDGVSGLVPARARIVRPLPPIGAKRVAFDVPFSVPNGPGRRLVEALSIFGQIDHALARRASCGHRGGLEIDRLA